MSFLTFGTSLKNCNATIPANMPKAPAVKALRSRVVSILLPRRRQIDDHSKGAWARDIGVLIEGFTRADTANVWLNLITV